MRTCDPKNGRNSHLAIKSSSIWGIHFHLQININFANDINIMISVPKANTVILVKLTSILQMGIGKGPNQILRFFIPQTKTPNNPAWNVTFRWKTFSLFETTLVDIMAFPVVEFSREGYKIRKVFGKKSTVFKWNYKILKIGVIGSCRKVQECDFKSK